MGILLAVARRIPEGDQLCRNEGFNLKITDDNLQVDYPRQFLKGAHAPSVKAQHVFIGAPPSGFRRYGWRGFINICYHLYCSKTS